MMVDEGDQPYYAARHVGHGIGSPNIQEIVAYGIGKKTAEGTIRLWVLPGGMICGGDDVDRIGVMMVKAGLGASASQSNGEG